MRIIAWSCAYTHVYSEKRFNCRVDGVSNAVVVKGDAVGATLYCGPGAGAEPTGSAVISDIIELGRTLLAPPEYRAPYLGFQDDQLTSFSILDIEEMKRLIICACRRLTSLVSCQKSRKFYPMRALASKR